MHVLVVDDEADLRDLFTLALTLYGAEVVAAASSAEALEAFERSKPDVLVSDIAMPNEDGYDLIRKIRAHKPEHGGRIPAVALSGYTRVEDHMRSCSAGFDMHVAKPVEPDKLAAIIAALVVGANKTS
jgi:CheY-like chemotaxis protein